MQVFVSMVIFTCTLERLLAVYVTSYQYVPGTILGLNIDIG